MGLTVVVHIEIRRADIEDAAAGAWCHLLCWREAYAGMVEPGLLGERTNDHPRRTERWAGAIRDGQVRWLAIDPDPAVPVEERVIGFSAPGPARDEDAPVELELSAIYTRRAWWGTGLGDRLLDVAIGKQPAVLWVFEENQRALRFYRRHGFRPDGVGKFDPFFEQREIRMVRP